MVQMKPHRSVWGRSGLDTEKENALKQISKRLTYANVMSSIAVFLVLGGATAIAAKQLHLGKKTVGSKQLKPNAVTTAKIKKGAVTNVKIKDQAIDTAKIKDGAIDTAKIKDGAIDTVKIKDGAVNGAKVADGSLSGADINAASTSFTQVVARLRPNLSLPFGSTQVYPVGSYTQPAGETDQYVAGLDVTFANTCTAPRSAQAYLVIDAANPAAPTPGELAGLGIVQDSGSGTVTMRMGFAPLPGGGSMDSIAPGSAINHTFTFLLATAGCNSGSGVSASGGAVDVLGTK
jgi:hypothetical protein